MPVKRGVGLSRPTLLQAGALLHVYTDGSVLLTHGGIEMGQGLHTKMVQVGINVVFVPYIVRIKLAVNIDKGVHVLF